MFDFPSLRAGAHFDPDRGTKMNLPIGVKVPWPLQADITELSPDRIRWVEYLPGRQFGVSGEVVMERTGPDQARLAVDWLVHGRKIGDTMVQEYKITGLGRNVLDMVNLDDASKVSAARMPSPDRIQFDFHLPLGLQIDKRGKITYPAANG